MNKSKLPLYTNLAERNIEDMVITIVEKPKSLYRIMRKITKENLILRQDEREFAVNCEQGHGLYLELSISSRYWPCKRFIRINLALQRCVVKGYKKGATALIITSNSHQSFRQTSIENICA